MGLFGLEKLFKISEKTDPLYTTQWACLLEPQVMRAERASGPP
jgi:hypothetical protein